MSSRNIKKYLLYLAGSVLLLLALTYFATGRVPFISQFLPGSQTLRTIEIKIGDQVVQAEVAETARARETGLGGHAPLEPGQGMLFVYQEKDKAHTFWMKDMTFPIDIVWIDDGKVVKIDTAFPEPDTPDDDLTRYPSGGPIDYVLELPANFMLENGIQIGDPVDLSDL